MRFVILSIESSMEEGAGDTVTELLSGVDFENTKDPRAISNGFGPYSPTLKNGFTVNIHFYVVNTFFRSFWVAHQAINADQN